MRKTTQQLCKFFANPNSNNLIQDHAALANKVFRYVGRTHTIVEYGDKQSGEPGYAEFVANKTPSVVVYMPEYAKACRNGDLIAADEYTAERCQVDFDQELVNQLSGVSNV